MSNAAWNGSIVVFPLIYVIKTCVNTRARFSTRLISQNTTLLIFMPFACCEIAEFGLSRCYEANTTCFHCHSDVTVFCLDLCLFCSTIPSGFLDFPRFHVIPLFNPVIGSNVFLPSLDSLRNVNLWTEKRCTDSIRRLNKPGEITLITGQPATPPRLSHTSSIFPELDFCESCRNAHSRTTWYLQ